MRLLANFVGYNGRWDLSFLREDAHTPVGRPVSFDNKVALVKAIEKMRGNPEEARNILRRWGQGSVWVDLSPAQCRFFRIQ